MANERRTLVVRMRITGLREAQKAFARLPKDANTEIRAASLSIAGYVAVQIKASAARNAQSALMVPTVRAIKDRVPVVQAGGNRRVGRNKVQAHKVLFGSEFGAVTLPQYRAFNSDGYWFFVTVKDNLGYVDREWNEAWDEVIRRWAV